MPQIKLLPKHIAELIAAGEVVERPASVIKELLENSIDAKASVITVEIKNGGVSFMRVTDNGCGINKEDVRTAFLRHATSKISSEYDLERISSLGFRGEALASVSAVSRVELLTKAENSEGVKYVIRGGEEIDFFDVGCPNGTTIIIRDIFYNTPARMKFLKKDVTEGNAVAAIVERLALSHPEISFKFIRDDKLVLNTSGDNKLLSAIYSCLGKDFSSNLIEVNDNVGGIKVTGFTCSPYNCRANRNGQYFFVNKRFVRSGTAMAAVEQAYKNSSMVGKFPAFVLFIDIPFETVDVNVHPAKTEIRFSNEKMVFDAVYVATKNALFQKDERPSLTLNKPIEQFEKDKAEQSKFEFSLETKNEVVDNTNSLKFELNLNKVEKPSVDEIFKPKDFSSNILNDQKPDFSQIRKVNIDVEVENSENEFDEFQLKLIGEVFGTYIIVQYQNKVYFIDKHAAHERIIFNSLNVKIDEQLLLIPLMIKLSAEDYNAIINNIEILKDYGIVLDDFGDGQIMLRAVPSVINGNYEDMIYEIAEKLRNFKRPVTNREEELLHSISCKAAIKSHDISTEAELIQLAGKVLSDKNVMYCPHGRAVAFELTKSTIEKQFGRIK